jgi:hypothetical protein
VKRRTWALIAATVLFAGIAGGVMAVSAGRQVAAATQDPLPNTAPVIKGTLSDVISAYGTVTYRASPDGSPYLVVNQRGGIYTELPAVGDEVECGTSLYRVDDQPVLLLCGSIPAYRSLAAGDQGADAAELNADLVTLGYATKQQLDPASPAFTVETADALSQLQTSIGQDPSGSLPLGQVVFLPESVRVAAVTGQLGAEAQAGAPVLSATSDTSQVQVGLDPTEQYAVKVGDRVQITLPNNAVVAGRVTRVGNVVQAITGQNAGSSQNNTSDPTIPLYLSLDQPQQAQGFDQASVQVLITTAGVADALNVPVTAIVATSGGGFAVEVVRAADERTLVRVTLGLFDDSVGRVQVSGDLHAGDHVVVPPS